MNDRFPPNQSVPSSVPLNRRSFIGTAAAAGAGAALSLAPAAGLARSSGPAGDSARTPTGKAPRVPGIQLYTLRGSMAENADATLTAVAAMGYGAVEFAGLHGNSARALRSRLDDLGLDAPAGHVDPHALKADPGPLIEDAVTLGHRYLVVAWLAEEFRQTADDYRGWADVLNRAGEAAKDAGIRMAYHNHEFEFETLDGEMPQRILLAETDPSLVDFELDFYWVTKAELEIADVLAWAPERFTLAHIKDMDTEGNITDVGTGTIDFAGLLNSEHGRHIIHPFVEHDHPPDAFRTAAVGRWNLSRALEEPEV
ncbi:MAG: sugar phosphate isomerase/epimerase [Xanthomonadales bacterium]|jgi:sugar phosphate isomerase/epimerase|nr:sugar phosphate isomerase/epimerase [Xanthomonadales bacterium]